MEDRRVSVLFTYRLGDKACREKIKLMALSFIKKEDVTKFVETKEYILIISKTHYVRIIAITQSIRGYRADFFIDMSGDKENHFMSVVRSTYNRIGQEEKVKDLLNDNGWES